MNPVTHYFYSIFKEELLLLKRVIKNVNKLIHLAFDHIINELNSYLSVKISESDRVMANNLLTQDGNLQNGIDDKVVVSLVNTEEERMARDPDIYRKQPDGTLHIQNPEIRLYLYLLFTAYFPSDYNEALKMISLVIAFFQKKNKFTPANTPDLDPGLKGLTMEMVTLNMEQQNHLWASVGAKYIPSVLYKMRLVTIAEDEIDGTGEPITEIHINDKSK